MLRITNKSIYIAVQTILASGLLYHPWIIYIMEVHVAGEHSSFKNVNLVAIQHWDPQAWILKAWVIFSSEILRGMIKITHKARTPNLFMYGHKWIPGMHTLNIGIFPPCEDWDFSSRNCASDQVVKLNNFLQFVIFLEPQRKYIFAKQWHPFLNTVTDHQ